MKRILHIALLIVLVHVVSPDAVAQDYFMETLEKANRATPYEAVYILSDYQQFMPTFAATYYHLGVRYYNLIPTEHPIRDYNDYKQILYRTKLYFGNCLHYAKDQTLKVQHYAGLPISGKKPEYADLERFIRAKLDSVEIISSRSEAVYQAYYRLVNRYADCRNRFTAFSELYLREKTAHLLLTDADRAQLNALQILADSLQDDIRRLQAALHYFPISGYSPQFTWAEISLYRLDGLTNTDLLQNNIVLWKYGEWVRQFLNTQEQIYTAYYDELDIEYGLMQRAIQQLHSGKRNVFQTDEILLNRIDRLDYQSFMKDFIATLQRTVQVMQIRQDSLFNGARTVDNDYIEQAIALIHRQHRLLASTEEQAAQLRQELEQDTTALTHYTELLTKWHCNNRDSIMRQTQELLHAAHGAYSATANAFAKAIEPTLQPFEYFENELTGEKFWQKDLKFEPEDSIRTILPVEENFMLVLKNGTCLICSADGKLLYKHLHKDIRDVLTAYKYTSNTIALVAKDNVVFVNKDGL